MATRNRANGSIETALKLPEIAMIRGAGAFASTSLMSCGESESQTSPACVPAGAAGAMGEQRTKKAAAAAKRATPIVILRVNVGCALFSARRDVGGKRAPARRLGACVAHVCVCC